MTNAAQELRRLVDVGDRGGCTACGYVPPTWRDMRPDTVRSVYTALCQECGHIYVIEMEPTPRARNLTRSEKALLPQHPCAAALREFQGLVVSGFVG
jgi:hypothetical protein